MSILSIYEALKYVTKAELFITASPIQKVNTGYKVTGFAKVYTICGMCTILSCLLIGIVGQMCTQSDISNITGNLSVLAKFIAHLELIISVTAYIISNISQQFQRKNHIELIECLHKLDTTLIKEFQVNMNYHKIVRKNVLLLLLFPIFFLTFTLPYVVVLFKHKMIFVPLIAVSYIISYMALGVSSYAAMNFADLIRIRFRLFQKLLNPEFLKKRYKNEKVRMKKFKILVETYQDTFYIMKKLSEVYGVSLLMVHFHDFIMTTNQLYYVYWKSTNGNIGDIKFLNFIFWMVPMVWKSIFLPLYMHLMMNEVRKP